MHEWCVQRNWALFFKEAVDIIWKACACSAPSFSLRYQYTGVNQTVWFHKKWRHNLLSDNKCVVQTGCIRQAHWWFANVGSLHSLHFHKWKVVSSWWPKITYNQTLDSIRREARKIPSLLPSICTNHWFRLVDEKSWLGQEPGQFWCNLSCCWTSCLRLNHFICYQYKQSKSIDEGFWQASGGWV